MKKLAIITTHPIQYYAPVFKLLAGQPDIDLKVFYTWGEAAQHKFDPGFGKNVDWDLPLLEGYAYKWATNTSARPGSHNFMGIVNPYLIQDVKNFGADALLVVGWAYHGHLAAMRYFKGKVPIYFRGDSTLLDQQSSAKNLLKQLMLKWVYKHVDYVFYPGTLSKAYFTKFGLKNDQLIFAPHAVDNNRFSKSRRDEAAQLRNSLGIKPKDKLVLFAGKLEEKKDPMLLLSAFRAILQQGIHLLFVGNGKLEAALKHAASGAPNIHFIDFVNQTDMPVVYQAANLFCLPSKGPGETWGLAINEAMACAKAVLASNKVGCAPDLVKPGYNGDVFESGDLNDLTGKLSALLSSEVDLASYGSNSARIISDWTFEQWVEAIKTKLLK